MLGPAKMALNETLIILRYVICFSAVARHLMPLSALDMDQGQKLARANPRKGDKAACENMKSPLYYDQT